MSASFYDLMKYAKTGIASPEMTNFDKCRALAAFGGYPVTTITGVPPLPFKSDGSALTDYSITGNMVQSSTPSPQNPVYPTECGDLVASGEHAGEYAIPITCGSTQNIYLQEPIRKIGEYVDVCGMSIGGAKRRVKKIVFNGTETPSSVHDTKDGENVCAAYKFVDVGMTDILDFDKNLNSGGVVYPIFISSHFMEKSNINSHWYNIQPNECGGNSKTEGEYGMNRYIIFCVSGLETAQDYKDFFAQQYANGTPVTVWYVLASETTETSTMPTITTAKGINTLTVGTTLPPSSVSITGHIK